MHLAFGSATKPTEALAGSVEFRGFDYPTYRLAILVAEFDIAGPVWLVLKRTDVGLVVRLRRAGYEAVATIAATAGGPAVDRRGIIARGFNGSTTTSRCAIRDGDYLL